MRKALLNPTGRIPVLVLPGMVLVLVTFTYKKIIEIWFQPKSIEHRKQKCRLKTSKNLFLSKNPVFTVSLLGAMRRGAWQFFSHKDTFFDTFQATFSISWTMSLLRRVTSREEFKSDCQD
jgi:hypothetical protein